MLFLNYTPELSAIDFTIYRYLSDHLETVRYMRIRELAKETHTSTASIQRFCKKFECSGFYEFKVKLSLYLDQKDQTKTELPDASASIDFLQRTQNPLFQDKIDQAVALLSEKELILFIGVGSSNIMAEYGIQYFASCAHMALRIEDPMNYPSTHISPLIGKQTCIVALSVSGETQEIIQYLSHIQFASSSVLSITNRANNTIAQLSDVNIPYFIAPEAQEGSDITSQLPTLYILELLAKKLHQKKTRKV